MPRGSGPGVSLTLELSHQAGDFSPQAAWAVPFHGILEIAELRSLEQKRNSEFGLTVLRQPVLDILSVAAVGLRPRGAFSKRSRIVRFNGQPAGRLR